ncbi:MAG: hypothetical protein H7061_00990 [Bdellovibrionaceae bacterium]|nr:hypothetical protein [Bdellovibrio sp.]
MTDKKIKVGVGDEPNPIYFEAHQKACENQQDTYIDPETGLQVITSFYLLRRGYCCTSGCRHCPYGMHELNKKK